MTPAQLAELHDQCFETPRAWSEAEFAGFLLTKGTFLICSDAKGFVLGRVVVDEVELITIAVAPSERGKGLGKKLLGLFEEEAVRQGASTGFLEVAAFNTTAQNLYSTAGWCESGIRPRYYRSPKGEKIDAVMMAKAFDTL